MTNKKGSQAKNFQFLKQELKEVLGVVSNDFRAISKVFEQKKEILKLAVSSYNSLSELESDIENFEQNLLKVAVELPEELVKVEDDGTTVLSRISKVLSQNEATQAIRFVEGVQFLLNGLREGDKLLFESVKGKDKIATQLFRNPFAHAVKVAIINALDNGVIVGVRNRDGTVSTVDLPTIESLYSEGIRISVLERTEVYDGLFSEKYNPSHYNQFLQWSFGLARRQPQIEFNVLLNKYDSIVVDHSDITTRAEKAIELLKLKKHLFGLSENGLKNAVRKIRKFNELLLNFSEHKEQQKKDKIAEVLKMFENLSKSDKLACAEELKKKFPSLF